MSVTSPTLFSLLLPAPAPRQTSAEPHAHHAAADERGAGVMGFDHQTTAHHFLLTADDGQIAVSVTDPSDADGTGRIRAHLQQVTPLYSAGDVEKPRTVHGRVPPGVEVMKRTGSAIVYGYEELPGRGGIRLTTSDAAARAAIHEPLRSQIADPRTGDPLEVRQP